MNKRNILSIIKKELRSYFDHLLGYILISVFLIICNFFFFKSAFMTKEASLRSLFEFLPWLFLFLIPAVTMKSIATEQKEGTIEVVLAQPISEVEFLVGKFLGNWFFVLITLGMTLFIPILLSFGGSLDIGTLFAQYLGAFFLSAALVALGMFASSLTKNQTVAFITSLFATVIFLLMGLEIVTMSVPYPLNDLMSSLGILSHFSYITKGVIDLRDVIYFVSLTFVFLSFNYLLFMAKKLNRKSNKYKSLQAGIILMVVIAIITNLFGAFISLKTDLTKDKVFSLSQGTRTVLSSLDDVVTIKFYASKELPPEVALLYRTIKDTLQDYKNAAGSKIQFIQKFPDEDEKAATEAQSAGIQPVQFNIERSDELLNKKGYLGIAIQYGDKKEAIPFVNQTNDLEYQITSLIRKSTSGKEKKIVFVGGHGEKDLNKDLPDLGQALSKEYTVDFTDNKTFSKKIGDADVAIIAGPKQKYSDSEKQALKDFIDSGKSVFFLIDTLDINMQYMMVNPSKDSLADLVEQFGVKVNSDVIYDLKSKEQVNVPSTGGTSFTIYYPFWPILEANPNHIVTKQLKQMSLPWASSLDIVKENLGKAKAEPILQTTIYAGHQTENYNISPDEKANKLSDKNLQSFTAAYALRNVGKSNKGRIIIVGDSDFISKDFLTSHQQGFGLLFNSLDWLSQDELLIGIRSRNAQPNTLSFESDTTKLFVHYFNLAGLPIIIFLLGLWRMNRRRNMPKGYVV